MIILQLCPESFHTKKLCSRLYSIDEVDFYSKSEKIAYFSKGVGHFERKCQTTGGIGHQPLLVSENYSDCNFVWYQNIGSALFGFVTKHACYGQTSSELSLPKNMTTKINKTSKLKQKRLA